MTINPGFRDRSLTAVERRAAELIPAEEKLDKVLPILQQANNLRVCDRCGMFRKVCRSSCRKHPVLRP